MKQRSYELPELGDLADATHDLRPLSELAAELRPLSELAAELQPFPASTDKKAHSLIVQRNGNHND